MLPPLRQLCLKRLYQVPAVDVLKVLEGSPFLILEFLEHLSTWQLLVLAHYLFTTRESPISLHILSAYKERRDLVTLGIALKWSRSTRDASSLSLEDLRVMLVPKAGQVRGIPQGEARAILDRNCNGCPGGMDKVLSSVVEDHQAWLSDLKTLGLRSNSVEAYIGLAPYLTSLERLEVRHMNFLTHPLAKALLSTMILHPPRCELSFLHSHFSPSTRIGLGPHTISEAPTAGLPIILVLYEVNGGDMLDDLYERLSHRPGIRELRLESCLDRTDPLSLLRGQHPRLSTLHIADVNMTDLWLALCPQRDDGPAPSFPLVRDLTLSHLIIGTLRFAGARVVDTTSLGPLESLCTLLRHDEGVFPSLTRLVLDSLAIHNDYAGGIPHFAKVIEDQTQLRYVSLLGATLPPGSLEHLLSALSRLPHLKEAHLADIYLRDEALEGVGRLMRSTSLSTLSLSFRTRADRVGPTYILAEALPGTSIRTLILDESRIDDETLQAVLAAWFKTPYPEGPICGLEHLSLRHNRITVDGLLSLAYGLGGLMDGAEVRVDVTGNLPPGTLLPSHPFPNVHFSSQGIRKADEIIEGFDEM